MKKICVYLLSFTFLLFVFANAQAADNSMETELINIKTFDGYQITGKLDLPGGLNRVPAVVIYVPGTGPCTYDNHRDLGGKEFNYFDLFAEEFTSKGIAFFSYDTRGTTPGTTPPYMLMWIERFLPPTFL